MLKNHGGNQVGSGTYWNFNTGERIDINGSGSLPGSRDTVYYRLPASGILVLGPVMGLLYAAFLPFIGIAMLVRLVMEKTAGVVLVSARSASFGWRPSESYLSGRKKVRETEKKDNKPGDSA